MTEHRKGGGERRERGAGLPLWLTCTVVLAVVALLAWNIVVVGPEGYPVSIMLGGLLGTYSGFDQLLKLRPGPGGGGEKPPTEPPSEGR